MQSRSETVFSSRHENLGAKFSNEALLVSWKLTQHFVDGLLDFPNQDAFIGLSCRIVSHSLGGELCSLLSNLFFSFLLADTSVSLNGSVDWLILLSGLLLSLFTHSCLIRSLLLDLGDLLRFLNKANNDVAADGLRLADQLKQQLNVHSAANLLKSGSIGVALKVLLDLGQKVGDKMDILQDAQVNKLENKFDHFFADLEEVDAVVIEVLSCHLVQVVCFKDKLQSLSM